VTLTFHPLLAPWSRKSRAIPLHPLWAVRSVKSLSACTRGALYLFYSTQTFSRMNTQTQQYHSELTQRLTKYLIAEERQTCLKLDKNIGHFTSRRKGALLLLVIQIRHKIILCATLNIFALFTATCSSTILRRMSCHTAWFRLLREDVRKQTRSDTLYVRTFHSPKPSHVGNSPLP
jgi:hypothetical protein